MNEPEPLLIKLRRHCAPAHERLHIHPLLAPLNGGAITPVQYGRVLQAFHAVYRDTETRRAIGIQQDVPDAPALDWLTHDLTRQGLAPLPPVPGDEPVAINDLSQLMGYLYVKQGSTLGGQVMSRHLKMALGLEPGVDNHFFNAYGAENGAMWKQFMQAFDAVAPSLDHDSVIATASRLFGRIAKSCDDAVGIKGLP